MALPFLKNKNDNAGIAGTIIKNRNPDTDQSDSDESEYSAEDCAHDLMDAIKAGDAAGVAKAVKDLANIADKEPHEEGEHKPSPHTYDAQNIAAAKDNE